VNITKYIIDIICISREYKKLSQNITCITHEKTRKTSPHENKKITYIIIKNNIKRKEKKIK